MPKRSSNQKPRSESSRTFEQKRERFRKTKGFSKRHLFVIPINGNRSMIVKEEIDNKKRKIWDKKKEKIIDV